MKRKTSNLLVSTTLLSILLETAVFTMFLYNAPKVHASPDWLSGWTYRRKLTVTSTLISESLTDFPVLVKLDSSFFDFDKAKSNGEDIRFTSSDGTTLLKYEIERWDKAAGKAEVWVKLPSISSTSNTDFYIYYGNSSASDAQEPANVWDSKYVLVLHLKETSGTQHDSTFYNNDGTPYGGLNQNAAGKINGADDFDNTDDYIAITHSASLNYGDVVTFELWINPHASSFKGGIDKGSGACYILGDGTGKLRLGKSGTGTLLSSASTLPTNSWSYVTAVKNKTTTNGMKIYINGNLDAQGTTSTTCANNTNNLQIGKRPAYNEYLNSIADEVRISNIPRTDAWIKASYNSENNSLLTYGDEEGIGAPMYSNIGYNATHTDAPCKFYVKWTDADGLSTCTFSTNNTGTWQDHTIPVSGTASWANITQTLNSEPGVLVGFRWYCNDTNGNIGDTGIRTLKTTGDWQYAKKLQFDNSAISENLIDFPVMVNLSRAGSDFWSHVGTGYKDLRFVDGDCVTDLYFEVEYWNYAEQKAYVWVKVPKIDAGSTTDFIYVYYGNPSPPEPAYHIPAKVWDSNFVMCHHLEETGGTEYDSTSNHNDGTPYGSMNQNAAGKIDGADSFDGNDDYVNCGNNPSLTVTQVTIEALVKRLGNGIATTTGSGGFSGEPIIAKGRAYVDTLGLNVNYFLGTRSDRVVGFDFEDNVNGGNHPLFSTSAIQDNQWYYLVVTHDGSTSRIYINGVLNNSTLINKTPDYNPWAATIGSAISDEGGSNTPKGFFNGIIDETRISNNARSGEWIEAQHSSMSDQYITFGSEQPPNNPPNKPTDSSPPNGAVGVPTSVTLSVRVTDPDADTMDVYFYQPGTQIPAPDFTIIALPDTQIYCESYPSVFDTQTQWIVDNAQSNNIVFVTHEGDIVNQDMQTQWNNANNSMSKLDNHVPWGILPGNHDGTGGSFTNYNTYFGPSRFSGKTWYGGCYPPNDNANNYELFTGGRDDYLIFHFQYAPTADVLTWANTVISNYPDRRVIVTTHDYLNSDGTRNTNGNFIWQNFIEPHADQVFLVLCGHVIAEARRTDTVNSHNVHQLLCDFQQSRPNGGNGWLRILEFSPADDKIYVETYSPYLNSYETDSNSQFTLDYDMTGSSSTGPSLIEVATNVPSGGVASVGWNGLKYGTTYQWYAVAVDINGATRQSDTWSFTTLVSIESCNQYGSRKDQFNPGETIYVNGSGFSPNTDYNLYIVSDVSIWTNGMDIPTPIVATSVRSDSAGTINPTAVWGSPLPGKYDIIVDVNDNGRYDIGIDALDDNDIVTTAGFFVIPEYALGTILALAVCFAGVALYRRPKRTKEKTYNFFFLGFD